MWLDTVSFAIGMGMGMILMFMILVVVASRQPPGENMVNWKTLLKGVITSIGGALADEEGLVGKVGRLLGAITDEIFEIVSEIISEFFDGDEKK